MLIYFAISSLPSNTKKTFFRFRGFRAQVRVLLKSHCVLMAKGLRLALK